MFFHVFAQTTHVVVAPHEFACAGIPATRLYIPSFIEIRSGVSSPKGSNLAFPITFASRFYNSLYYRTRRDLFRLVLVLKLISDCLGFSAFFVGQSGLFLKTPNGNTDYDDDVRYTFAIGEDRLRNSGVLSGTIFIVFSKYFKSK